MFAPIERGEIVLGTCVQRFVTKLRFASSDALMKTTTIWSLCARSHRMVRGEIWYRIDHLE